ncbi:BZ3500_MvSof-1268-A1-R1_Chr3-1g06076 [Microbotryum saponariae]|uniref:BZ3500_MvSof-1268-A1-R1_Chr3-1g06076 protein n=1 Tax=Microbotryum saponariae TaxID=289078 RepID=A0A2X0N4C6_9BASI|nr:BZ3500_MvSof-1268-A1-R1_Chr3-1g06076 [Microbotryum saponariae]SDA03918.1 BZ3501_MvSof-1269-A2-R1_Chr3-2g05761 [Microbotryum saponariae]
MDILPHTPPPLQPSSASKRTDKTKRKKSTTVRRRRKKVTCSNKDTIENGATTSVGTEEEAKTKKKKRRLWTKRVRKREPSLSPDNELFDKTFGFNFGIFRSPTKRRPKRQPSPPPSPSVQRSTRRRKEKEHSKKSIAGLHKSSSEPWTDIADGATAWPLDTETGGFEHDFEPNSAPGFEPDFEPDYDFGRDFGGGYSSGPEHSPFHPDGASQDQAPSSLKRSRIERNAKKQRNRRRTARAEAKTRASKRPELFQAYLLMKKKAKEVLRQSGFVPSPDDEEWCDACHERRVTRKVRVVDLFFAGMRELRYCPCYSEIQTLAAHGFLPTSSSSNRKREGITAFTFRTIEYLDTYWGVDPFGIYGMSEALILFWSSELSSEDPFNKVGSGQGQAGNIHCFLQNILEASQGPTVRQHLQAAMDEYRFMQQLQATLTAEILGLSPRERLADVCPACFGPRIDEAGKSENDLDVIIAVDGNFQHRRFARANADPLKSRPALFLPPDKIRNEQALIDGSTEAGEKDECTANWKAADGGVTSASSNVVADTGLVAAVCRHDHCLRLCNLHQSGEKLVYPVSLLKWILEEVEVGETDCTTGPARTSDATNVGSSSGSDSHQSSSQDRSRVGVAYDIACNLSSHLRRVSLFVTFSLSIGLVHHLPRLEFALSSMHAYAHKWSCQVDFDPRFLPNFGLTDGEGTERLWSQLRGMIPMNRSSSASHRLENINRRASAYNKQHLADLVTKLNSRLKNAIKLKAEADRVITEVVNRSEWTVATLLEQWHAQRAASKQIPLKEQRKEVAEMPNVMFKLELVNRDIAACREELACVNTINTNKLIEQSTKLQQLVKQRQVLDDRLNSLRTSEMNISVLDPGTSLPSCILTLRCDPLCPRLNMSTPLIGTDYEFACTLMVASRSLWDLVVQYRQGAERLRLPRLGGKALGRKFMQCLLIGTKAAGLLVKNLNSLRPRLMKAVAMYNDEVKKYAAILANSQNSHSILRTRRVPPSAPEDLNELLKLDILTPLWNNGLYSHPTEPWAYDDDVRVGIPAVLSRARCQQEIKRLGWEVRRIGRWLISRRKRFQQVRQQLLQLDEQDDSAMMLLEREEERLRTIARRWFSKGGLDHLWECTRQSGEPQTEEWVELRMWCTDDVEVFQRTTAGGLPDHTWPDCIIDGMVGESDDITTDHDALLDISDHSSDDLSHHSVDTTDYGAFSDEINENFDEDDGDVFGEFDIDHI